jgi:hypothetical protein
MGRRGVRTYVPGCGKRAKRIMRQTREVKRINDRLTGRREARERRSDESNSVGRSSYEYDLANGSTAIFFDVSQRL